MTLKLREIFNNSNTFESYYLEKKCGITLIDIRKSSTEKVDIEYIDYKLYLVNKFKANLFIVNDLIRPKNLNYHYLLNYFYLCLQNLDIYRCQVEKPGCLLRDIINKVYCFTFV